MKATNSDTFVSKKYVDMRDVSGNKPTLLIILKCPAILAFFALFIYASIDHVIMQYCSLLLIVIYVILEQIRQKKVLRRATLCVLSCIFFMQTLVSIGKFPITILNLSLLFLYLLVYISIFWSFIDNFKTHQIHHHIDTEQYVFWFLLILFGLSVLLGDFSVERFSGPFQNVLNFTGVIAIVFSLYVAFYGTSVRALFLAFCVFLIGIISVSKILTLLALIVFLLCGLRKKFPFFLGILILILLSLVNINSTYEIIQEVQSMFSLREGPIFHRLERYANLLEFNGIGIPLAHPSVCSKTISQTCLTSESFFVGFVLVYGFCGLVALSLVLRLQFNPNFLPLCAFLVLTGGFFTPSAILAAWSVLHLQKYIFHSHLKVRKNSQQFRRLVLEL